MTMSGPGPRALLVMRDAPDLRSNKGGLFPTAIKHHVDLGFDVHVASMSEMTPENEDFLASLGARCGGPEDILPAAGARA